MGKIENSIFQHCVYPEERGSPDGGKPSIFSDAIRCRGIVGFTKMHTDLLVWTILDLGHAFCNIFGINDVRQSSLRDFMCKRSIWPSFRYRMRCFIDNQQYLHAFYYHYGVRVRQNVERKSGFSRPIITQFEWLKLSFVAIFRSRLSIATCQNAWKTIHQEWVWVPLAKNFH